MKIEQDKIIEIKSRIDIRDLISEYMTLKKAGTSLFGLCPFHNEKTPSFSVNQTKQFFNCFGCGERGDHFTFLQKIEGITFPEALYKLAMKAGVSLEQVSEKEALEASKKVDLFRKLYKANAIANKFFIESFKTNNSVVQTFLKERNLSNQVVDEFQIGYAEDSWNKLTNYLADNNVPLELANQLGLIKLKPNADASSTNTRDYYDCFRNRIVFPIIDTSNKVLGFSCRKIDNDSVEDLKSPKYINSPESIIYKKRDSLYGINLAYKHISTNNEILLVEGNIDCMAISAIGKKNVVATLGTALTATHIKRLQRLSPNIILIFDGDKAGEAATERSFDLFASLNNIGTVKTILLPDNSDPDSFIRKHGAYAFDKLIMESKFLTEFLIDKILSSNKNPCATEKVELFKKCENYINKIEDPLAKQSYYKYIENVLGLESVPQKLISQKHNSIPQKQPASKTKNDKTEETLLEIILNFPLLNTPIFNKLLTLEIFELFITPELKIIGKEFIKTLSNLSFNENSNIKVNENNYHEIISKILTTDLHTHENTNVYQSFINLISNPPAFDSNSINEVLSDCISKIIKRQNKKLVTLAKEKIRKAEFAKDDIKTILALDEYQRLVRQENAFSKEY